MSAANTIECIDELRGERLMGIIADWPHSDIIAGAKALVFESGRALVLGDNGSYWVASVDDVQRVVSCLRDAYERAVGDHRRVLELAAVRAAALPPESQ